jgi:hypothetical protein
MTEYSNLLDEINNCIENFNNYLKPEYHVDLLDKAKFEEKSHYCKLKETLWDDQRWPNSDYRGVYFIFGRDTNDPCNLGVYIGKSSWNSAMGHRIYSHLYSPARHEKNYFMTNRKGEKYSMEFITSISLDNDNETIFLTPALEEFMISRMSRDYNLLNSVGY